MQSGGVRNGVGQRLETGKPEKAWVKRRRKHRTCREKRGRRGRTEEGSSGQGHSRRKGSKLGEGPACSQSGGGQGRRRGPKGNGVIF